MINVFFSTNIRYVIVFFVSQPGGFCNSIARNFTFATLFLLNSCTLKLFKAIEIFFSFNRHL